MRSRLNGWGLLNTAVLSSLIFHSGFACSDEASWKSSMTEGMVAYKRNDYPAAVTLFEAALKEAETFGQEDLRLAVTLNNIASLYIDQSRFTDAEPLMRRSLEIKEKKLGPDHPDVANTLNGLGEINRRIGQFDTAEKFYIRSLAIAEKNPLPPDQRLVPAALDNLYALYQSQGRTADSMDLLKRYSKLRPPTTPVIDAKRSCQVPEYPSESRRNEEQGTVIATFLIDVDGHVLEGKVDTSSGYPRLDQAVVYFLSRCMFRPGTSDGQPIKSWAKIKYTWKLR